jgi:Zn-dependent protease with chaperone function
MPAVRLPGISSRAFEHPADRAALVALRSVPGFDQLLRVAARMLRERQYRLAFLASAVRVGPRQFADLDAAFAEVVAVLDVAERPEVYVVNDPQPNAFTLGVDRPFIVLSSGLYELMAEDERAFVLGHELGHAMSGHALYWSMLAHLLNLASSFGWVPVGGIGLRAIIAALREWQRKSELSGDRAGLLAVQDLDVAIRVQMKMAGGAHLDRIDPEAFLAQAAEYEATGDLRDGVLKLLNTERTTHPWSAVRAAELHRWGHSEDYAAILRGEYPQRSQDQQASFTENAREAAGTYRQRMATSTDPLVATVRTVGAAVGEATSSVVDWIERQWRGAGSAQAPSAPADPGDAEDPFASVEPGNAEGPFTSVEPGDAEDPPNPAEPPDSSAAGPFD